MPTYETIEKIGKDFTVILKKIDKSYLPVEKVDDYELDKYFHSFNKVYDTLKKDLDSKAPST